MELRFLLVRNSIPFVPHVDLFVIKGRISGVCGTLGDLRKLVIHGLTLGIISAVRVHVSPIKKNVMMGKEKPYSFVG